MADPKQLKSTRKISQRTTVEQFDAAYFYIADLKDFARGIGISVGNLRKVELEQVIRNYLSTGTLPDHKPVLPRKAGEDRDELQASRLVVNYVGDKKTKSFLLALVHKKLPDLKDKSGQWYWLNDWRRKKQESMARFTYQDMADHLESLMSWEGRLPQIPSARMNNFITDFRADPKNKSISRRDVLTAWNVLKLHVGPKTYAEYCRINQFK
jgi:SAP domain-containing new25